MHKVSYPRRGVNVQKSVLLGPARAGLGRPRRAGPKLAFFKNANAEKC